jgi:hypothetical protein
VVVRTVKHVAKLQAIEALRPHLDAVNLVAIPKAKTGRALKNFVKERKRNVAPTLTPSTVRAAESHLHTHIFPTIGDVTDGNQHTERSSIHLSAKQPRV